MTATDKVLLAGSVSVLAALFLVVAGLFVGGAIIDRLRTAEREREHPGAGSVEQATDHLQLRRERAADQALNIESGMDPKERARRAEWRRSMDTMIADVNARFDAIAKVLDAEQPIVWKVDVRAAAIDEALKTSTRERILRLGEPDPATLVRWAATDPGVPPLLSQELADAPH